MSNIWSKNRYIEIIVDVLIYLMSINFFHYGQLILPIICILIFIDRKCKFYVKNIKVFTILCLFGISFYGFSYYLGFYSVMGFCFPMAYYIGTNMNDCSEESIKKVIYLIVLGMVTHYFLNFIYELTVFGWIKTLTKSTRYDIWLQDEFVSTGTATNAVIMLSIIYYILTKENDKLYKTIGIILFIFTMFYTFIMRRRTQLLLVIIVFVISFVIDVVNSIRNKNSSKGIIKVLIGIILFIIIVLLVLKYGKFSYYLQNSSVFAFSKIEGIGTERLEILVEGIKYLPKYMFGGQHISSIIGMPFHDLLLNIYDYAGIIPTVFMVYYIVICLINTYKIVKSYKVSIDFKLLIIEITLGYIIMCIIEPLMTGSSLFIIVGILIEACVELLI